MSVDTDYPLVFMVNEDFAAVLLLSLHGNNNEDNEKQDIVTNIEFEAIVTSIKNYFFNQRMVDFVNKLELNYQKYKTNGTVRDESYKGKFSFPMKDFVSFGTYRHSMIF